jgi:RNA polymerase sigma-70 factor (ECF subfamily)
MARKSRHPDIEFTAFVTEHRPSAVRYATFFTQSTELAKEIVSDAFITAWQNWSQKPSDARNEAWIIVIVKNQALNTMRSERARSAREHRAGVAFLESRFNEQSLSERVHLLHEVWGKLDDDACILLAMSYLENKSHDEIARVLGISAAAVSMRLSRLRRQLKEDILQLESESAHG